MAVLKHAENFSLSADTVDALTGKRVGRPASATFRTLDVVGLDVMSNVVKNIYENAKDDPWIELFKLPAWIDDLIEKGCLGSKTKKGVYEKKGKEAKKNRNIVSVTPKYIASLDYAKNYGYSDILIHPKHIETLIHFDKRDMRMSTNK